MRIIRSWLIALLCTLLASQAGSTSMRQMPGLIPVSLTVYPAKIERELARFLWIVESDIGTVTVSNPHGETAIVTISASPLAHDLMGNPIAPDGPGPLGLVFSPEQMRIPPMGTASIRLRANIREMKNGVLYANLNILARPVPDRPVGGSVPIGMVSVPILAKIASRPSPSLEIVGIGVRKGEGRNDICLRVRNAGHTHFRVSGEMAAETQGRRRTQLIEPVLVLPGCERILELPWTENRHGAYTLAFKLLADGVAQSTVTASVIIGEGILQMVSHPHLPTGLAGP